MRSWWNIWQPQESTRLVEEGRVYCPAVRRDVDVDRCMTCPRLKQLLPVYGSIDGIVCEHP